MAARLGALLADATVTGDHRTAGRDGQQRFNQGPFRDGGVGGVAAPA